MDFNSRFNSREAAAIAKPLHLRDPSDNSRLIYDLDKDGNEDKAKPCLVYLFGVESARVQDAQAAIRRERAKKTKATPEDEQSMAELQTTLIEGIVPMVSHFENISKGDKLAKAPDDVDWLFNMQAINPREGQQSFIEQAAEFVGNRAKFLGNGASK